jgi:transposase-like protein
MVAIRYFAEESPMTILDKSTLSHLYLEEQLTIRAIADKLGVNPRKIHDAMRLWHIPRRSNSTRPNRPAPIFPFDEATLRYHYHDVGQTIKQIAEHFNVSSWIVFSAMKYWDIPRRRCGPRPIRP